VALFYNGYAKPFERHSQYVIETINEVTVIMIIYHVFCFTEFVPDPKTRHTVGWSLIVTITCNLLINVFLIIKELVSDILQKCKLYQIKKR